MAVSISTYWHTVRHLKPIQIWGRIWNRMPKPGPGRVSGMVPRQVVGTWRTSVFKKAELEGPRTFRILNQKRTLKRGKWEPTGAARLWKYHLHYFDDLNAKGAEKRRKWHRGLITAWILENPPGQGTGWEPYPTSRRIVNWVKYFYRGLRAETEWLDSLATQADWLSRRLEWHLLGNHLLANAKALVFAGSYFEGTKARSWQEKGMRILEEQISEQILPDGGHEERSPMYQALILEDILDLMQLGRLCPDLRARTDRWMGIVGKMLDWLLAMTHPDGGISFFNDAAEGMAGRVSDLTRYAAGMGIRGDKRRGARAMQKAGGSGYFRLKAGPAMVIGDLAPLGPDHLPAHGHADTLSFEMSLGPRRVFVNVGTSEYGSGVRRQWERGTEAHNTVCLNGVNSSETWDGFRVGKRAQVFRRRAGDREAEGGHDGYEHLPGRNLHRRRWKLSRHQLLVEDEVSPPHPKAKAIFRLAPGLRFREEAGQWEIRDHGRIVVGMRFFGGIGKVEKTRCAKEFGRLEKAECLVVEFPGGRLKTEVTW